VIFVAAVLGGVLLAVLVCLALPWLMPLLERPFVLYERYLDWVERRRA
jgi:hypothetical protein